MDIHKKKVFDSEIPLNNDTHEAFCREYVRLDIDEFITNKRARRIKAYRAIFPETVKDLDSVVNSRAVALLARKTVKDRIRVLYEEEGSSIETEYGWTRFKSENILIGIAYDDELKTGDRLKAISELNKMRGIDVPVVKEAESSDEDTVEKFFASIKDDSNG